MFKDQYGLARISAEAAWSTGRGAGVKIAVVDSAVDLKHEDLADKLLPGDDFAKDDDPPARGHMHGTHVSGIAAAMTGNAKGVAGTAPDACIMPIRVLGNDGSGEIAWVNAGIKRAADRGAQVINLSLGDDVTFRNIEGSTIETGIEYAWSKQVIVVISAGNDFLFPSGYRDTHAIVVGATDRNDVKAAYSNLPDAKWSIVAPGSEIVSSFPGNNYGQASGTSMAAPHVSGAAAVLRGLGLNAQQTIDRLLATADDIGPEAVYGSGRLNLAKAVQGFAPQTAKFECTSGKQGAGSGGIGSAAAKPSGGSSNPGRTGSQRPGSAPTSPDASNGAVVGSVAPSDQGPEAQGPLEEPGDAADSGSGNPALNIAIAALIALGIGGAIVWSRIRGRAFREI